MTDTVENQEKTLLSFCIHSLAFLSLKEKQIIKQNVLSTEDFLHLSLFDIQTMIKRVTKTFSLDTTQIMHDAKWALKICQTYHISYACYGGDFYPAILKELYNAPYLLFYRGNIQVLSKPCIAVVGTRVPTQSAVAATVDFTKKAVAKGKCIVSGLALGIDAYSHKTAIQTAIENDIENGATVAVLSSGVDTIVPHTNKGLAKRIIDTNGCLISEYLPGTPPLHYRFVARDRLIAALSYATVIAQAPNGSGALITARFAAQENRGLYFFDTCFSQEADMQNKKRLESLCEKERQKPKYKRNAKSFVEDGAKIIQRYEDLESDIVPF